MALRERLSGFLVIELRKPKRKLAQGGALVMMLMPVELIGIGCGFENFWRKILSLVA
jgi:hypothetical protein